MKDSNIHLFCIDKIDTNKIKLISFDNFVT